jgi:hypothetical protein
MLRRLLRPQTSVFVSAFMIVPAFSYLSPAIDSRVACERGREWAIAHASELPSNAAQLAAFPEPLRRPIFSQLSPEMKAAVWRDQLAGFEKSRPLSANQLEFLRQFRSQLVPSLYSDVTTPALDAKRFAAFKLAGEAQKLFGPEELRVLYQLGYALAPEHSFASRRFILTEALRDYAYASSAQLPQCNCVWDDDCGPGWTCSDDSPCAYVYGCGPRGIARCLHQCENIGG